MLVTPAGSVRLVRLLQPWNALAPMLVTVAGIVTAVRPLRPLNALSPTPVTGRPKSVAGIATAPSAPV